MRLRPPATFAHPGSSAGGSVVSVAPELMTTSASTGATRQANAIAAKATAARREIRNTALGCGCIRTVTCREEYSVAPTGRPIMRFAELSKLPRPWPAGIPPKVVLTRLPSLYMGWVARTIKLRPGGEMACERAGRSSGLTIIFLPARRRALDTWVLAADH